MANNLEIKPTQGFGDLKFGADKSAVEAYFGTPQETEKLDIEGEVHEVEVWSYWDQGHSVYFEKELNDVCTNFETDNEDASLFGRKIFEMTEDQILELMQANGYKEFELEEEDEDEKILFFGDAHLQFVFEGEELALVSWAVAMDDDERIVWPA